MRHPRPSSRRRRGTCAQRRATVAAAALAAPSRPQSQASFCVLSRLRVTAVVTPRHTAPHTGDVRSGSRGRVARGDGHHRSAVAAGAAGAGGERAPGEPRRECAAATPRGRGAPLTPPSAVPASPGPTQSPPHGSHVCPFAIWRRPSSAHPRQSVSSASFSRLGSRRWEARRTGQRLTAALGQHPYT
jgi:hypothetical protein